MPVVVTLAVPVSAVFPTEADNVEPVEVTLEVPVSLIVPLEAVI